MPPNRPLAAALLQLDQLISTERAALEADPAQLKTLLALRDELKRLKPGQVPAAKTLALLKQFFSEQLAAEERSLRATRVPVVPIATAAKSAALSALSQAQKATAALDPQLPEAALQAAALKLSNVNAKGEAALGAARAQLAFAKAVKS